VLLGGDVAALDALGERDLLLSAQQWHAPDRAQVEAQRVEARLDRQVDVRAAQLLQARAQARALVLALLSLLLVAPLALLLGAGAGADRLAHLGRRLARSEDLDAVLPQVAQEVLSLLRRELRLLDRRTDRVRAQEAALLPLGDDALKLLHLCHRLLGGHLQTLQLLAHSDSQGPTQNPRRGGEPTRPP